MSYLYVDSTYDLSLGVLDDDLNWLAFESHSGVKASAIIQDRTAHLLHQLDLKIPNLAGVISVSGPGFYTGLRLSEGFADVLGFFGVRLYSFYSYEVPLWSGFQQGTWFTKAYRGEYFIHRWEGSTWSNELVSASDLAGALTGTQFFIHSNASLDSISTPLILNPVATSVLIREAPRSVFAEVLKGQTREPFYFRAPEDEFRVNP